MNNFRSTLLEVAKEAFKERKISRVQLMSLRVGMAVSPKFEESLKNECFEQLVETETLPASANIHAIDWAGFAAFLKEILPLLLQILPIFLSQNNIVIE
jgi:hypothetical protein